jgi:hypothetical protein
MIQPMGLNHICLRLGASKRERSQIGRNKFCGHFRDRVKCYQAGKPVGRPPGHVLFRAETDDRRDDAEVPDVSWHAMGTIQTELGGNKRRGKS